MIPHPEISDQNSVVTAFCVRAERGWNAGSLPWFVRKCGVCTHTDIVRRSGELIGKLGKRFLRIVFTELGCEAANVGVDTDLGFDCGG